MWAQCINAALGIWLMMAPDIWGFEKKIADNDHIVGPIIATLAITAIFENTRLVRKGNIPAGLWLVLAPWILQYETALATINDMVVGGLVIGFSFIKGKIKNKYGGGWLSLFQKDSPGEWEAKQL
jgi:hypothetical protein